MQSERLIERKMRGNVMGIFINHAVQQACDDDLENRYISRRWMWLDLIWAMFHNISLTWHNGEVEVMKY